LSLVVPANAGTTRLEQSPFGSESNHVRIAIWPRRLMVRGQTSLVAPANAESSAFVATAKALGPGVRRDDEA
jgi:hypothetical protein